MKDSMLDKNEAYWKEKLTPEEYRVLREKGTERAFSGELHDNKEPGRYRCKACGFELFSSEDKFDSGTGWPSFFKPAGTIETAMDGTFRTERTEVLCPHCGSHLGHVFGDAPEKYEGKKTTGQRYCINSCALDFEAK